MMIVIGAILAPSVILAQLRSPLMDIRTGVILDGDTGHVVLHFVVELLLTATVVGALAGWFLGRSPQASIATALAGLVYAIGPGHNIPLLGSTPAVGKGLVLLLLITLVSVIVLVEVGDWLANK